MREVELARRLAQVYHFGQQYAGRDFFETHVCEVARLVQLIAPENDEALVVAYLHDIVEDTPMTLGGLRDWFPSHIVQAVSYLTHEKPEPYMHYIRLLEVSPGKAGKLARIVKVADLTSNRLRCIADPQFQHHVTRYTEALAILTPALVADYPIRP